jgi:uncharacterized protein (DUF1330 family)
MPGYVIVEIDVTDPEGYEEYRRLAAPTVEAYGGRYLVRGGRTETLEGDWQPTSYVSSTTLNRPSMQVRPTESPPRSKLTPCVP